MIKTINVIVIGTRFAPRSCAGTTERRRISSGKHTIRRENLSGISKGQFEHLSETLGRERVLADHVVGPYTTFNIGGPADAFYEATSAEELAGAIVIARNASIPFFVLGLGANILLGDKGFRGLVIRNSAKRVSVSEDGILEAESGAVFWPNVINIAIDLGWSGLEHYAGIPSTVGGALWQNLHFLSPAPKRERTMFLEEVVLDAQILSPDNIRRRVTEDYFDFGYDQSIIQHSGDIVLVARFQLEKADSETMRRITEENLEWRSTRHPPLDTEPSAGSIFKKIEGIGAGRLIDECGLKGTRKGGIEITHRHANIMINRGGATAQDVLSMIEFVVKTVEEQKGYVLEPEIAFIGEF